MVSRSHLIGIVAPDAGREGRSACSLVPAIEMLDQYERQACVGRQIAKQFDEGVQIRRRAEPAGTVR